MLRYAKQIRYHGLGTAGQGRLNRSTVLVAGAGGLGGTMAMLLSRAGVGTLRIVDRDRVELSNLHRQLLFDEADVQGNVFKAKAAEQKLKAANSQILIETHVADIGPQNVSGLMAGVDLVMDGLDNYTTRHLINRRAVEQRLPWLYAGVMGAMGNLMLIQPGKTPCLACLYPESEAHAAHPTADELGIIGPAPAFAASWAAAQALKFLSGSSESLMPGLFQFNLWKNSYEFIPLDTGPVKDCPVCGKV